MILEILQSMKDRRKLERFALNLSATIEVVGAGERKASYDVTTSDICAGGAFFCTPQPLPKGDQVRIEIILPLREQAAIEGAKQALLKVTGKVLRTEPLGMAVGFDDDYQIRPYLN